VWAAAYHEIHRSAIKGSPPRRSPRSAGCPAAGSASCTAAPASAAPAPAAQGQGFSTPCHVSSARATSAEVEVGYRNRRWVAPASVQTSSAPGSRCCRQLQWPLDRGGIVKHEKAGILQPFRSPHLRVELQVRDAQPHEAREQGLVQVRVLLERHVFDHRRQLVVVADHDDALQAAAALVRLLLEGRKQGSCQKVAPTSRISQQVVSVVVAATPALPAACQLPSASLAIDGRRKHAPGTG
jgi:hypothetical protein